MSKATLQDILDEGFRPDQFGFASNATTGWNDAGGYLARVLEQAGRWAADKIGADVYAAAQSNTYLHDCLARAEVCHCRAVLFTRRVAFLDSSATVSLGEANSQHANRREMLAHADAAWQCAQDAIAEAIRASGGDPTLDMPGGASFGHIETGHFPPVTA